MRLTFLALSLLIASSGGTAIAQSAIDPYVERSSFNASTQDLSSIDFEGVAPNSGFRLFKREGEFSMRGVTFRPAGGARFGPGHITIVGGLHYAGPALETTSGAKLTWQPPNQPGSAYIDITVPHGTTAVGLDLWAVQPYVSPIEVTVTTVDGESKTVTVNTPERPSAGFVGFTSTQPIASVRLKPAKGQTGLIIDNVALGHRGEDSAATMAKPESSKVATGQPAAAPSPRVEKLETRETTTNLAAAKRPDDAGSEAVHSTSGTIAYVRGGTEIRLTTPDGRSDRQLWTDANLTEALGIYELAWRPDGKELAFSSSHASSRSLYHADIYAIRPDGSGIRRITNAPAPESFGRFRKGTVNVTVSNGQAPGTTPGIFIVYIAGAPEAQQVVIPAGQSKTVTFTSVADFGNEAQPVVAVWGNYRWFNVGADVVAGRTVSAAPLMISGGGIELFGAFRPIWRSDGSRISHRPGLCVVSETPAEPMPGVHYFKKLFGEQDPSGACTWDWGPTPATANQIIYTENDSGTSDIYRVTEGGVGTATKLTTYSDINFQLLADLQWMPDASGLIYSNVTTMRDSSNIYRYDFASKRTTQLTDLKNEFAREFSISPDGRSIVFERCKDYEDDKGCDLWLIGTDGRGARLLMRNGNRPAWGK